LGYFFDNVLGHVMFILAKGKPTSQGGLRAYYVRIITRHGNDDANNHALARAASTNNGKKRISNQ